MRSKVKPKEEEYRWWFMEWFVSCIHSRSKLPSRGRRWVVVTSSHTMSSSHRIPLTGKTTARSSSGSNAMRRRLDRRRSMSAFESPPLPTVRSPAPPFCKTKIKQDRRMQHTGPEHQIPTGGKRMSTWITRARQSVSFMVLADLNLNQIGR